MFETVGFVLVMGSGCFFTPPKPVVTGEQEEASADITIGDTTITDGSIYVLDDEVLTWSPQYGSTGPSGCTVRMFEARASVEAFLSEYELKSHYKLLRLTAPFETVMVTQTKRPDYKTKFEGDVDFDPPAKGDADSDR